MRVAIIGAGVAGLSAAARLAGHCEVSVFEASEHVGGHSRTVDVPTEDGSLAVDTGFITFRRSYPHFCELLDAKPMSRHWPITPELWPAEAPMARWLSLS